MLEINSNILSLKQMLPDVQTNDLANAGATYVGIDFGTSTTVVSIAAIDGNSVNNIVVKPMRIKQLLEDGTKFQSEKLPTVLAWYNNRLLVGEGAANLKYTLKRGKDIWYSFKMEIGEDLGAKYYDSSLAKMEGVSIRNPKDCVRMFFKFLRPQIENYCKENNLPSNIQYAVSIPASFEANQRKELLEALETNGMSLSKQSLIDEPNAAFISYVNESYSTGNPLMISPHYNSKVLVFDFGAGTCDISILEVGKNVNGIYSKNIAISKFTKCGGDDVDRYITFHYLIPRFFAQNNVSETDFITKERKYIATQLYKAAEQLKILISKYLVAKMVDFSLPDATKESSKEMKITVPVSVDTSKGNLKQSEFYLTIAEFVETMQVFTKKPNGNKFRNALFSNTLSRLNTLVSGEDEYNSVFSPIESAIRKANVPLDEIDYVLLIGGSAQNPCIQEALHDYFKDSKMLIPRGLQTHVSQGAAIHSLFMNGLNKCIIKPITSEPIFIITKDSTRKILVPAGTVVPCDTIVIDDLETVRDKQKAIELPICVGSENKMLFNLKITPQFDITFPQNAKVSVAVEINADKALVVRAECMGNDCMTEPLNPFANKELTTEERVVLKAEREANLEAEKNGGVLTKDSLERLRTAYEKAGRSLDAAETYEQQYNLYPQSVNVNNIGVLYNDCGKTEKAVEFYEKALEESPNSAISNFNLGHTLMEVDRERGLEYIKKANKLDPNHNPSLILLADEEERNGNRNKANEMRQKAYDNYMSKWKANKLRKWEYSWFSSVADDLGEYDIANEIRNSQPKQKIEGFFNEDNLVRSKSMEIENL